MVLCKWFQIKCVNNRKLMPHAQTYQMKWPDQLSQVKKKKAQHNNVSQKSKKKKKIMLNSQWKHKASARQPPLSIQKGPVWVQFRVNHQQSIHFLFFYGNPFSHQIVSLVSTQTEPSHLPIFSASFISCAFCKHHLFLPVAFSLTHAGDDAVHR